MYYIAATIFRLYEKKGLSIPYFRMLFTLMFMFFISVCCLGLIFNIPSKWIFPWDIYGTKVAQWLQASIYFGLLLSVGYLIFSPSKIEGYIVSDNSIKKASIILPLLFIGLFVALIFLLIMQGIRMGKIH